MRKKKQINTVEMKLTMANKQLIHMNLKLFFFAVNKVSPRPSIAPDSEAANSVDSFSQQSQSQTTQSNQGSSSNQQTKPEPGKARERAGACRVCLKSFKPDDFSKICFECQQKVCEDCASYSKLEENEDAVRCHFLFFPFFPFFPSLSLSLFFGQYSCYIRFVFLFFFLVIHHFIVFSF